jgi:hypothetical protein
MNHYYLMYQNFHLFPKNQLDLKNLNFHYFLMFQNFL